MHVAVLGGGVVGVATAYFLIANGHRVTLIERGAALGAETSYANGAQLSYSYTDSLARPEFLLRIPSLLLGLDPAVHIGVLRNFALFHWGLRFLGQCTHVKARENTLAVLKLALRSADLLEELRVATAIDFAYRRAGKLVVLADKADIPPARERARLKREHGCDTQIVSRAEALELEPALDDMRQSFAAAIYSGADEVGDAHAFVQGMAAWLCERGLSLRLQETAEALHFQNGRFHGVRTDKDLCIADAAVVCLGPWSAAFLRQHGVQANVYPVRGYSVTLPHGRSTPAMSITNLEHRIVFSQLPSGVRIAGFADFVGYDTCRDGRRVQQLLQTAERLAPQAADYRTAEHRPWGGFRPVTPNSRPLVGASPIPGVYLNVGHGVLGWTLACAAGYDVAQAIEEQTR